MKTEDAIARIKAETHDISDEYSTKRCIGFLNTAIQQISSLLISAKWPVLVKETTVSDGDSIPKNFLNACGNYPLSMTDGKVKITDSTYKSVNFRYFSNPDFVDETTTDMPFTHEGINDIIVKSAVLLALNENEYDITQDSSIVDSLKSAISSGIG